MTDINNATPLARYDIRNDYYKW